VDLRDKLTYLPSSNEGFDPTLETVETFETVVREACQEYVNEQAQSDMPVSLVDFAVRIIHSVGRKGGVDEYLLKQRIAEANSVKRHRNGTTCDRPTDCWEDQNIS
jgi:hypothetical protein